MIFSFLAAWRLSVGHGILVVIPNAGISPAGISQKNHHLLVNNHTFLLAMSPKRSIFVGT